MQKATTAIIIVNYRTPWHLERCLHYAFKHTQDFHVYLVHNKPDSQSAAVGKQYAQKYPEQITIFNNAKNLGFVGGVNTAYEAALAHKYICLLNSDVLVTPNWLGEMVAVLDTRSDIAQVAPDTNQYYPESTLWKILKQLVGKLSRSLWYQIYEWRYYLNPPRSELKGFHEYEYFFQFCGGFCTLFRAEHVRERGFILDPQIVHGYWDDNELSFHLRQFGKVGKVEHAYVFHYLNVSFNQVNNVKQDLKRNLQQLNGYYVAQKWQDFILAEIAKLDVEKTLELVRNTHEVDQFMQFLGLMAQRAGFSDYLKTSPARQIGEQFLN
jgi:GT2 family glycosyltransferase